MSKKILMYMHAGSGNHGCEAIVNSTCHLLNQPEVYVLTNDKAEDERYSLGSLCNLIQEQKMQEQNTTTIETFSAEETLALGQKLGQEAKPGEVYTLLGDLGVGKTVLTQGIAQGLDITEPICSPTFTIVQVYDEGRMPFYHFDVYRIGDIEEMDEIGYEDYFYGNGLCMIEWANLIEEILPEHYREITIEKDLQRGFDYRRITIKDR